METCLHKTQQEEEEIKHKMIEEREGLSSFTQETLVGILGFGD